MHGAVRRRAHERYATRLRADAVGVMLVLLLVGAVASFISSQEKRVDAAMKAWVGHSVEELLIVWGPPTQILESPGQAGARIYVYSDEVKSYAPGRVTVETRQTQGDSTVTAQVTTPVETEQYAYRLFWVDGTGRIYRTSWRGLVQSARLPNAPPPVGR